MNTTITLFGGFITMTHGGYLLQRLVGDKDLWIEVLIDTNDIQTYVGQYSIGSMPYNCYFETMNNE